MLSTLWDFVVLSFMVFLFVVYLMILIGILKDLFRDSALNGWFKVIWVIFLVWIPYLTAFVYLIARGKGMAERTQLANNRHRELLTEAHRGHAALSPAGEISKAKQLLDAGTITPEEFSALKSKALGA